MTLKHKVRKFMKKMRRSHVRVVGNLLRLAILIMFMQEEFGWFFFFCSYLLELNRLELWEKYVFLLLEYKRVLF
jgi:hypothetical protein